MAKESWMARESTLAAEFAMAAQHTTFLLTAGRSRLAAFVALTDGGEVAFVSQAATRPQEIWLWDQKSAPRQVTHLNDSWKQYALSEPEFYTYKSFDGMEIQAALLKPRVSQSANQEIGVPGKSKLPLIA